VIGDIGADIHAAWSAGARGILVPAPVTRAAELTGVRVSPDIRSAVRMAAAETAAAPVWAPGCHDSGGSAA
jgi:hypothetical protein